MKNPVKLLLALVAALIIWGALYALIYNKGDKNTRYENFSISVSIPPLKYIIDRITGGDLPVNVILPAGSSPETYEPSPKQLKELESSPVIVVTGLLDFENSVVAKITSPSTSVIKVHEGITLIDDDGHSHHHDHGHTHSHSHGVDPHIWTSVSCLKIIAKNVMDNMPDKFMKDEYSGNYHKLIEDLDALDTEVRTMLAERGTTAFLIYHPALTYFARDYGLEQVQLEQEGKEPSADRLIRTIAKAKDIGFDKLLYQKEFSIRAVETAAKDIGAVPVEIDPLDENIITNIHHIAKTIAY